MISPGMKKPRFGLTLEPIPDTRIASIPPAANPPNKSSSHPYGFRGRGKEPDISPSLTSYPFTSKQNTRSWSRK